MSATALKSTKWRLSSLNHQNYDFFLPSSQVTYSYRSDLCKMEPNISSLGNFKKSLPAVASPLSAAVGFPAVAWEPVSGDSNAGQPRSERLDGLRRATSPVWQPTGKPERILIWTPTSLLCGVTWQKLSANVAFLSCSTKVVVAFLSCSTNVVVALISSSSWNDVSK